MAGTSYIAKRFESSVGELPYQVHFPEELNDKPVPLILFLHGSDERGDDNNKQLIHGAADIVKYTSKHQPCIVLAPQCPENESWVDVKWDSNDHQMAEKPSRPLQMVIELMDQILEEFWINEERVYVTGLSMGGFATWEMLQRFPSTFAAGIPICGGADLSFTDVLKDIPVWAFHGDADEVVNDDRLRAIIEATEDIESEIRYTLYEGVGHDCWTQTYKDETVYQWLFEQKLEDHLTPWQAVVHWFLQWLGGLFRKAH